MSTANCTEISALCPVAATTYGYIPIAGANYFYAVFFGVLLLYGFSLSLYARTWSYAAALGIGALLETLGYIGRCIMHHNVWDSNGFIMQIVCLIIGPSFLAAAVYLTLKHLVLFFGPEHSYLPPRFYPWLFIGFDIASIVVQAVGGGISSSASDSDGDNTDLLSAGNDIMIAGIAIQVATMAICGLLVLLYAIRYARAHRNAAVFEKSAFDNITSPRQARSLYVFCASVVLAYVFILIRCIYRLPEMAGGWGNSLMQDEPTFLVLDGA